jgi:hypothetical protein
MLFTTLLSKGEKLMNSVSEKLAVAADEAADVLLSLIRNPDVRLSAAKAVIGCGELS